MAADVTVRVNDGAVYLPEAPVERVIGYDSLMPFFAQEQVYMVPSFVQKAVYIPDAKRIAAVIEWVLDERVRGVLGGEKAATRWEARTSLRNGATE